MREVGSKSVATDRPTARASSVLVINGLAESGGRCTSHFCVLGLRAEWIVAEPLPPTSSDRAVAPAAVRPEGDALRGLSEHNGTLRSTIASIEPQWRLSQSLSWGQCSAASAPPRTDASRGARPSGGGFPGRRRTGRNPPPDPSRCSTRALRRDVRVPRCALRCEQRCPRACLP